MLVKVNKDAYVDPDCVTAVILMARKPGDLPKTMVHIKGMMVISDDTLDGTVDKINRARMDGGLNI